MPMTMQDGAVFRRRRLVALAVVAAAGVAVALGIGALGGGSSAEEAPPDGDAPATARLPELPGGGRRILPGRRVVGFYGHPTDAELGVLGIGAPAQAGRRLAEQAAAYKRPGRPVLPAFELLASIATADPGGRGDHSLRTDDATIARYLRAARAIGAILILDIQPGSADFLGETRRLQRWLKQPDVSLALDPEWKVPEGVVPGEAIGATTAHEVNEVSQWLDLLTRVNRLPQKLLLVHQFTDDMVRDEHLLQRRAWVAVTLNADGFGDRPTKTAKYHDFAAQLDWPAKGFKLFYREDDGLMTPRQVLALRPAPEIVVYE
jgi:hypothetical protein